MTAIRIGRFTFDLFGLDAVTASARGGLEAFERTIAKMEQRTGFTLHDEVQVFANPAADDSVFAYMRYTPEEHNLPSNQLMCCDGVAFGKKIVTAERQWLIGHEIAHAVHADGKVSVLRNNVPMADTVLDLLETARTHDADTLARAVDAAYGGVEPFQAHVDLAKGYKAKMMSYINGAKPFVPTAALDEPNGRVMLEAMAQHPEIEEMIKAIPLPTPEEMEAVNSLMRVTVPTKAFEVKIWEDFRRTSGELDAETLAQMRPQLEQQIAQTRASLEFGYGKLELNTSPANAATVEALSGKMAEGSESADLSTLFASLEQAQEHRADIFACTHADHPQAMRDFLQRHVEAHDAKMTSIFTHPHPNERVDLCAELFDWPRTTVDTPSISREGREALGGMMKSWAEHVAHRPEGAKHIGMP